MILIQHLIARIKALAEKLRAERQAEGRIDTDGWGCRSVPRRG